jgi:hypothetical protein
MAYSQCQLRRIEQGLCIGCAKPSAGKKHCKVCYERNRETLRAWRVKHPQKVRGYSREWRKSNSEQVQLADRERYAQNPENRKKHTRKWHAAHPGYNNQWAKANPEKNRTQRLRFYWRNRQRIRQHFNAWRRSKYAANPIYYRDQQVTRRALKANAQGTHTQQQWVARVAYYGWRCRWCRCELTVITLTMDHVIPLSAGGSNWASNLVPACGSCNSGKHTKRHYVPPSP